MDMTNEKVIEKKVYEDDNRKHDYASKGVAGTALGLGSRHCIGSITLAYR